MNRNNKQDKSPIDDLFARKLGNAALPTAADGFARLQARMGQAPAEKKPGFVIWRNPNIQRSMAIAACLLLVCLFGWFYLSTDAPENGRGQQVATTKTDKAPVPTVSTPVSPEARADDRIATNSATSVAKSGKPETNATGNDATETNEAKRPKPETSVAKRAQTTPVGPEKRPGGRIADDAATSIARSNGQKTNGNATGPATINQPEADKKPDQIAAVKPIAPAERVLVVTIDEPERLITARQIVKLEAMEASLAAVNKPEKAAKHGFWEQVQRVKHGEIFARPDGTTDERSLLDRAYSGLKNSLEKDKTVRQ